MTKKVKEYLYILNLTVDEIKNNNKEWITEKIRIWDEELWRKEKLKRKTLEIYNEFKKHIQEEAYYNEESSLIIFKMRSNTLRLNDKNRHVGGNISCMCGHEIEDLEHFLLDCPKLEKERMKISKKQKGSTGKIVV